MNGYALYAKRGDTSMRIEHMEHYGGEWEVQLVSNKGKDGCRAYVEGGCGLEACTSRVWWVFDEKGFHDALSQVHCECFALLE